MYSRKIVRLELSPGDCALVSGRGHLAVERGAAEVLGSTFVSGSNIRIRPGKRFPIYAPDDRACVSTEGTFSVTMVKGDPIPGSWRSLPDMFLTKTVPKVAILGPTDSGKSALTTYLTNVSLNFSTKVAVIDGDPGQSDIGPPTCISGAIVKSRLIDLRELDPLATRFVGVTSPSASPGDCIRAVWKVTRDVLATGVDYVFVNTDGWVRDQGIEHKRQLLEGIGPDLVVILGTDRESEALGHTVNANAIHVEVPRHILVRSPSARYRMRLSNLLRHLGRAKRLPLDPNVMHGPTNRDPGTLVALLNREEFMSLGVVDSTDAAGKVWAYCGVDSFDEVVLSEVSVPEVLTKLRERGLDVLRQ